MQRILVYFLLISGIAAGYLILRGSDGVTGRNVAIAIPVTLLFAALIWLRWDVAPQIGKRRRERQRQQGSDVG